jgi:hypothetical protein
MQKEGDLRCGRAVLGQLPRQLLGAKLGRGGGFALQPVDVGEPPDRGGCRPRASRRPPSPPCGR